MEFHERFNDEKGDVILRSTKASTDSDQPHFVHFKVRKAILSWQSDVFDTMFSLPQPSEKSGSALELPIIDLQDDPDDLAALLTVLHYPE